jgi:hypothetical protein
VLPKVTVESTERELARTVLSNTDKVEPNWTFSWTERLVLKNARAFCVKMK